MMISPMLARPSKEIDLVDSREGWVLEPKHDGMRAIVEVTENGVEIYSRTGKSQKGKCPHLEASLSSLPVGTVLDGEIAFVSHVAVVHGQTVPVVDFNKTMRIMGSGIEKAVLRQTELGEVSFLVFDVLFYGGNDVRFSSQEERFYIVDDLEVLHLMHNPRYSEEFISVYSDLVDAGIEGAILKDTKNHYVNGSRSKGWIKVKSAQTFDVVVTGYTDGFGKYSGQIGAIEFSAFDDSGELVYVGRCSGMNDEFRKELSDSRETGFVIEVKANEMVGSGEFRTPRHPQFVCVRVDKNPEDCLRDQFKV